jgi:hypothetical protein
MKLKTVLLFDENDPADDKAAVTINGKRHTAAHNSHVFDVSEGGAFSLISDEKAAPKKTKGGGK